MDKRIPEGTCSQVQRSISVDSKRLRASKFTVIQIDWIVILRVYYTIPFVLSLFGTSDASLFNFLNYFVWLRITDEGPVPEMHIWSILSIKSDLKDLKWCIHLNRSLFLYFNYLLSVTVGGGGGGGGQRILDDNVAKFTLIQIDWNCNFVGFFYTIPFVFSLFWHFWDITSIINFLNYIVRLRLTEDGSVPEMRIWSILLIKSDLKWCIHLSRNFFLYFNYLWVSLLVDKRIPEGTCSQGRLHLVPKFVQ